MAYRGGLRERLGLSKDWQRKVVNIVKKAKPVIPPAPEEYGLEEYVPEEVKKLIKKPMESKMGLPKEVDVSTKNKEYSAKKPIGKTKEEKLPITEESAGIETKVLSPEDVEYNIKMRYGDLYAKKSPEEALIGYGLPDVEIPRPEKPREFEASQRVQEMFSKSEELYKDAISDIGSNFPTRVREGRAKLGMAKDLAATASTIMSTEAATWKEPEIYKTDVEALMKKPEAIKSIEEAKALKKGVEISEELLPYQVKEKEAEAGYREALAEQAGVATRGLPPTYEVGREERVLLEIIKASRQTGDTLEESRRKAYLKIDTSPSYLTEADRDMAKRRVDETLGFTREIPAEQEIVDYIRSKDKSISETEARQIARDYLSGVIKEE